MINEPVPFLANIALVARADGILSAAELGQLEAIRKEYGFKKSDFSAAVRLAESGNHALTLVGTFADQVKNLELILRVAYANSDLDAAEEQLIVDYCHRIGIHQEQLDRILVEVVASLKQTGKLCPACAAENTPDARFCAKCGVSLDSQGQDIQVKLDIPKNGIAIEFAESTAMSFPKALELAKATPGYQTCQRNKKPWHLAVYPSGAIVDALPLASELSGIRNRALYIDGKEQQWDEVFGFAWCAVRRATAYRPVEYCFGKDENRLNPWGCKQARMDWTGWADWFCYGKWEKSGFIASKIQWRFDKERIKHELATNLYRCRYCPHLNENLLEAVLRHLPDVVVPSEDNNWDFHQIYEEVPGAIKVIQKERSDGFTYSDEFWTDGIRPKGLHVLADILSKAFREVNADSGIIKTLTK
ncbi:MAG: zinc ribbon domain-containing protein [Oligosphaeraceae bacterium]|nr:zinc ribbon domain-containing protein [Oligosphaeraceae bacterium]